MKIRNGFVSNSSSSSFVCDITGECESGMDLCLEDAGMYECQNGHIFLDKFLIGDPDADYEDFMEKNPDATPEQIEKEFGSEYFESGTRDEIPSRYCPICQMKHLSKDDIVSYAFKKAGGEKKLIEEIRSQFPDYKAFKKALGKCGK